MKNLPNIEKSHFRPGQYVGFANGRVYRISRNSSNAKLWNAHLHTGIAKTEFEAMYLCKTLTQLQAIFKALT